MNILHIRYQQPTTYTIMQASISSKKQTNTYQKRANRSPTQEASKQKERGSNSHQAPRVQYLEACLI